MQADNVCKCSVLQAIGTSVPYVFQATDYNSGDTLTYSLQPSAYSTDFTFALLPQPHLETAKKFVYSTMASPSVNVCKYTSSILYFLYTSLDCEISKPISYPVRSIHLVEQHQH